MFTSVEFPRWYLADQVYYDWKITGQGRSFNHFRFWTRFTLMLDFQPKFFWKLSGKNRWLTTWKCIWLEWLYYIWIIYNLNENIQINIEIWFHWSQLKYSKYCFLAHMCCIVKFEFPFWWKWFWAMIAFISSLSNFWLCSSYRTVVSGRSFRNRSPIQNVGPWLVHFLMRFLMQKLMIF